MKEELRLIGVKELIHLLGVSKQTIWRLRRRGIIPPGARLGGRQLWRMGQLRQWLTETWPCGRQMYVRLGNGKVFPVDSLANPPAGALEWCWEGAGTWWPMPARP